MIFYNKISSYHNPHAIIIFAFSLQNIKFLQNRQIALDGALAHRQDLRHFFPCYCRRLVNKTKYFPLTTSKSHLRHISVIFSDIRGVGRGKDDGLELGRSGFELGF